MPRRHTKDTMATKNIKKMDFVAFVRFVHLRVVKPSARLSRIQFSGS